ncbi:hypothetical protein SLS53_007987 [Cytospora paraplurivora]|uniref:Uncharacterized protein n=1 Tax=Cytospora paraplurivora TaxID=2898453 RepID=A0AAN9YBZ9_9PEZI
MDYDHKDGGKFASKAAQVEIEELRQEVERLRTDLASCTDQLFDILQKENDVPEQGIKDSFNSILTGIESWIDEVSSEDDFDALFKSRYYQNLYANDKKKRFADLGLDRRYYSDMNWLVELMRLESCHRVVISLVISNFLTHEIFRKERTDELGNLYPHGIPDDEINMLARIQDDMRENLQRGTFSIAGFLGSHLTVPFSMPDEADISRWRGHAVSALLTEAKIKDAADRKSAEHLEKLKHDLKPWLGEITKELAGQLMDNVIIRATKTLNMICRCNRTYAIGSFYKPPGPLPEVARDWPIKEIGIWRTVPPSSVTGLLLCLYPGVFRLGEGGQSNLVLVNPILLGYKQLELQPPRSPPPSRTPSPRKQETTGREREGAEGAAPRPYRGQSSSTQLARPVDSRPVKQKRPGMMELVGEYLWSNTPSIPSAKPIRSIRSLVSSPNAKIPASSNHQGRHALSRTTMPEAHPAPQVPPQQQLVQYPHHNMGSSGSTSTNPNTRFASTPVPSAYYNTYSQPEPFRYEDPEKLADAVSGKARKKSNTWQS